MLLAILALGAFLRIVALRHPDRPYFYEIYYATAAAQLAGIEPVDHGEWADHPLIGRHPDWVYYHPPLGKLLVSLSIRLAGHTPIGWRFIPCLLGLGSLLLFFSLASALLEDRPSALVATFFLASDSLHVLHSRLAMPDIILFFFTICSMLAMHKLSSPGRSTAWFFIAVLGLAGAASTKYVGALAFSSAIIAHLWTNKTRFRSALRETAWITLGTAALYSTWPIYYAAHGFSFGEWLRLQWLSVLTLAQPVPDHSFSSAPYSWLFNAVPVLYHFEPKEYPVAIIGMGNPAIWIGIIPALYLLFHRFRTKRNPSDLFILLWFAGSYLPLLLALRQRHGFFYYMLPSTGAMFLAVARMLRFSGNSLGVIGSRVYVLMAGTFVAVQLPLVVGWPMTSAYFRLASETLFFRIIVP